MSAADFFGCFATPLQRAQYRSWRAGRAVSSQAAAGMEKRDRNGAAVGSVRWLSPCARILYAGKLPAGIKKFLLTPARGVLR